MYIFKITLWEKFVHLNMQYVHTHIAVLIIQVYAVKCKEYTLKQVIGV